MLPMTLDPTQLPNDIATLKAMVIAAERKASDRGLEIEALKLTIAKLQRNTFGASSESGKNSTGAAACRVLHKLAGQTLSAF